MKKFKLKIIIFFIVLCLVSIFLIRHFSNERQAYYLVKYQKTDISDLIRKDKLNENDYEIIFKNTGVSPGAAKEIISKNQYAVLDKLNDLYFKKPEFDKNYIAYPVTVEENILHVATPVVNLKKGDILITFNTHTLDWRHGHCAIVIDQNSSKILEHASVGNTSWVSSSKSWGLYPGFIILRHPNEKIAEKAADYAMEKLVGIDYSIFTGLLDKDKSDNVSITSHCSHIVWQAYKAVGEDIDQNEGALVTPNDIAMCTKLKVVQIFGINPNQYRHRLLKN